MTQATLDHRTSPSPSVPTAPTLGSTMKAAAVGGVLSAVANFLVYGAGLAAGVEYVGRFQGPDAPESGLIVPMVGVASFVPALLGGLMYFGLGKLTNKARGVFVAIAVAFTLFSFGGPAGIVGASLGTKVVLSVMHAVAAALTVGAILRGTKLEAQR